MPAGDKECQPAAVEQTAAEEMVREEVEGGIERWEVSEGKRSRRKRKVNSTVMDNDGQMPPQFYSEVAPVHQLQDDHLQHEVSSNHKRQRLDECDEELPSEEQYGHEDGIHDDDGQHHQDSIPDDPHGNIDSASGEDIESVMRRQQDDVTHLLAKFEEALSEGIAYEAFFPVRIDEMLRATQNLEQSLLDQKRAMKERLQEILGIL